MCVLIRSIFKQDRCLVGASAFHHPEEFKGNEEQYLIALQTVAKLSTYLNKVILESKTLLGSKQARVSEASAQMPSSANKKQPGKKKKEKGGAELSGQKDTMGPRIVRI